MTIISTDIETIELEVVLGDSQVIAYKTSNEMEVFVEAGIGSITWGKIVGDINQQTDLITLINTKANVVHTHNLADLAEKSYNSLTDKPDLGDLHSHANKTVLDKFGENGAGLPTYNGNQVDTTIAQRDVYDGLDSNDNTISLSAKQGKVLDEKKQNQMVAGTNVVFDETDPLHPIINVESSGGSPFVKTVLITVAGLRTLIASSSLQVGSYYELTDFQTKNIAGFGEINTAELESLILYAFTASKVLDRAYSRQYPDDIIYYDISDEGIVGDVSGGWEDGGDFGDAVVTSNWHTSYFDMDKEPIMDDDFYFYTESDANGDIEYESDGLGDDFTITDNGDGTWRFTDLTGDAYFDDPDFNYGEIEFNAVVLQRNGNIYSRENPAKRISAVFDFRGVRYYRANVDFNSHSLWNSSTTWSKGVVVRDANSLYQCLKTNTGEPLSGRYWTRLFYSNTDRRYYFRNPNIYINNGQIHADVANKKLVHVFSVYDGADFIYNDDNVNDVMLLSEENVFFRDLGNDNVKWRNIEIHNDADGNTYNGSVINTIFPQNSKNNVLAGGHITSNTIEVVLNNCFISNAITGATIGQLSSCTIGTLSASTVKQVSSSILRAVDKCNFGYGNSNLNLSADNSNFGNNNAYFFLYASYYSKWGNSNQRFESLDNNFSNNEFGDLNKYFRFMGSITTGAKFGNNNGRNGTWLEFPGNVRGLEIGNDNFYLGASSFPRTVQNIKLHNNVSRIRPTGDFIDCNFYTGVSDIDAYNIKRVNILNATTQINMAGKHIQDSTWESGLSSFQFSSKGSFQFNHITTGDIDFGGSATHVTEPYRCEVYARPDRLKKLSFIGNHDTLEVFNPTD